MGKAEGLFKTDSICFASYLNRVRGLELQDHKKIDGRLTFFFNGTEEEKKKLKQEFVNSDCKKYDNGIWDFKKLLKE